MTNQLGDQTEDTGSVKKSQGYKALMSNLNSRRPK